MKSAILAFLLLTVSLFAHEGLHEQIAAVTERIAAAPTAELYVQRGELHRLHGEWTEALSDYDAAQKLDPSFDVVDFARGRMVLESGDAKSALPSLDRFLARHPDHADAHLARARALVKLDRAAESIADYDAAIAHAPNLTPDLFHERANMLAGLNRIDDALRGLDEGMSRLGVVVSLQTNAIDLEMRARRYDAALARLDTLLRQSARKESWLATRADILQKAGRMEEAQAARREALACIAALPDRLRNSQMTRDLAARLTAAVEPRSR